MLDRDRVKAFYSFMVERESIRLRRLAGLPREQWTQDEILQTYSFTNVKREHDRTTQEFKKIYDQNFRVDAAENPSIALPELFINCALYRYFGTIEAARAIGWVKEWGPAERARIHTLGDAGMLRFTAAYIVTSGGRSEPKHYVVTDSIDQFAEKAPLIVSQSRWQDAVSIMTSCYGCGSFMAKEVILDFILASGWKPLDWETWTPCGPGGKRGACRIKYGFNDKIGEDEALEVIREMYAMRNELTGEAGVTFWPKQIYVSQPISKPHEGMQGWEMSSYDTPKLDLTDIQFQCCEFDKYSRVPEGGKPKRKFRPTIDEITRNP